MSGVVWVPKSEVSYEKVIGDLRVVGQDYQGPLHFDCWHIQDNLIGLPRYWAETNGYRGNYSWVAAEWGPFLGSFRSNQQQKVEELHKALLAHRTTLFEAFPGYGKTLIGCCQAAKLGAKTLVIADREDLLDQWEESAMKFFNVKSGRIQGKKWDTSQTLTTAMLQTLAIKDLTELRSQFGLAIIDECHTFSCSSFHKVMPDIDSHYLLGVSATYRRADKLEKVWEHSLGKVTVTTPREKVEGNYQCPQLEFMLDAKEYTTKGQLNHVKLVSALANHREYNNWAATIIKQVVESGRKILVVSHRVEQCKTLQTLLQELGIEVKMYVETTSKQDLEEARVSNCVLASSKKIDKGVDIPELDTLLLLTPSSDPEQVVGRVSRRVPGKKDVVVIDPVFQHPYLMALWKKRVRIYTQMGLKIGDE